MSKLLYLIIYIFNNYPDPRQLSFPRLIKTIYLIDWKYSLQHGKQYTNVKWLMGSYGPHVDEILTLIRSRDDLFKVVTRNRFYGGVDILRVKYIGNLHVRLAENDMFIVDLIINNVHYFNWGQFMTIVYQTYPVKNSVKGQFLDLEYLSRRVTIEAENKVEPKVISPNMR